MNSAFLTMDSGGSKTKLALYDMDGSPIRERMASGFGTAEDVADAIDFFLSPASRWVTGQTLVCDGGHTVA